MKLNRQEVFETAVKHLYKQGRPAYEHGDCLYRTESGLMCAVGALISDDKYDPGMENRSASEVCKKYKILTNDENDLMFLDNLQAQVHDNAAHGDDFIDNMLSRATDFAQTHKLDAGFITQLKENRHD